MKGKSKEKQEAEKEAEETRELLLEHQQIDQLPATLLESGRYNTTITVDLSWNELTELPLAFFSNFPQLQQLILNNNKLIALNKEVGNLKQLRILKLDHNALNCLPQSIGELNQLELLSVSKNALLFLPISLVGLGRTLQSLNVSHNNIRVLPPDLGLLSGLRVLHMDHNRFGSLPCSLGDCGQLQEFSIEWLIYTPYAATRVTGETAAALFRSLRTLFDKLRAEGRCECSQLEFWQHIGRDFDLAFQDSTTQRTWLHIAARHNHLAVIEALLAARVALNSLDKEGLSPLCLAIKHENAEAAQLLLNAGADVKIGGGHFGSALHMAVLRYDLPLVRLLLAKGASANLCDEEQQNTPLHNLFANFDRSSYKAAALAETLLFAGAIPNAKNREGWGPLHLAAKRGQTKGIKWILRTNSWLSDTINDQFDINLQGGTEKWTALHLAGQAGHYKLVQALIAAGADLFLRNSDLKTPRQAAKGNLAIYKLFKREEIRAARFKLECDLAEPGLPLEGDREISTAKDAGPRAPGSFIRTIGPAKEEKTPKERKTHLLGLNEDMQCHISQISLELSPPAEPPPEHRKPLAVSVAPLATSHPVNVFYLKDKVLNNSLSIVERYDALAEMLTENKKEQTTTAMHDLLTNVLEINNAGLQLDIIQNAIALPSRSILRTLACLIQKSTSQSLQTQLKATLEECQSLFVQRPSDDNRSDIKSLTTPTVTKSKNMFIPMPQGQTDAYPAAP